MADPQDYYRYEGTLQPTLDERQTLGLDPYLPEPDLVEAVNLAIHLRRPLLLRGVPGCGKTRLARAVQYEFTRKDPRFNYDADPRKNNPWPLLEWPVKSTSEAQDGIYTYDAVGRLHDAQLASLPENQTGTGVARKSIHDYITYGALGRAFRETRCRPLVLLDEIDKADIDFPNDLLTLLEDRYFEIQETSQRIDVRRGKEPIFFITSNDEKDLPEPFLRRCVFYYIDFPLPERLLEIVRERYRMSAVDDQMLQTATNRFVRLRDEQGRGGKALSTSELIDWLDVLLFYDDLTDQERQSLLNNLEDDALRAPFTSVLFKTQVDRDAYEQQLRLRQQADQRNNG